MLLIHNIQGQCGGLNHMTDSYLSSQKKTMSSKFILFSLALYGLKQRTHKPTTPQHNLWTENGPPICIFLGFLPQLEWQLFKTQVNNMAQNHLWNQCETGLVVCKNLVSDKMQKKYSAISHAYHFVQYNWKMFALIPSHLKLQNIG